MADQGTSTRRGNVEGAYTRANAIGTTVGAESYVHPTLVGPTGQNAGRTQEATISAHTGFVGVVRDVGKTQEAHVTSSTGAHDPRRDMGKAAEDVMIVREER